MARQTKSTALVKADKATVIDIYPPPPERVSDASTAMTEVEACDGLPVFAPILEGIIAVSRDMLDAIDAHYTELLGPFEDALKRAKTQRQGVRKSWDAVLAAATTKLTQARKVEREERERLAEADRQRRQAELHAEAERQRQAVLDQLVDQATAAETTAELASVVEAMDDIASKPVEAPIVPALAIVPAPRMDALSARTDYVIEHVDEQVLRLAVKEGRVPDGALMVNLVWLNKQVAQAKRTGEILPGVFVTTRETFMRRPVNR